MRIPPVSSLRPIAYRLSAATTTTPFQMCVLNSMSRFHLAAEAIRRLPRRSDRAPEPIADCEARIEQSVAHAQERSEDRPVIRDWAWSDRMRHPSLVTIERGWTSRLVCRAKGSHWNS
jgi:hypothetical protein